MKEEEIEVTFKCNSDQVLLMTGFYKIILGEDLDVSNVVLGTFAWIADTLMEVAFEVRDTCVHIGDWSTSAERLYQLGIELEEKRKVQ